MKRLSKTGVCLLTVLLLLCAGLGAASAAEQAATPPAQQQADAIALTREQVQTELDALAGSTKNLWVKEMLAHASITGDSAAEPKKTGAVAVTVTVTYPLLASGVDSKKAYDGKDPESFVRGALENALSQTAAYDINATVTFREGREPAFKWHASKGFSGFKTALAAKAKAAATSFSSKPLLAALCDFVFTHPVRGAKIDLTGGPKAMKLSATAPGYSQMLYSAANTALSRAAYEAQGPNTENAALSALFDEQIAAFGKQFKDAKTKKAKTDQAVSVSFNPWTLVEKSDDSANKEVLDYRAAYKTAYTDYQWGLAFLVTQLPDMPALPQPETKRLEGGRSGTKVIIKAKKGDGNCMVRFLKGDDVKALCFVRDGERLTLYLPAGTYTMQMGSGDIWYGEQALFGPNTIASYSYDEVRIPSKEYYYTVTFMRAETDDGKDIMDGMSRDDFAR